MILDISRHNLAEPDFSISSQEVLWGRLLRSSNRFKAYNSYAIKLTLGRMIQVISPHTRSELDFRFPQEGAVEVRSWEQGEGPRITKFVADVICACHLVSPPQKSTSPRPKT